jgi:DNA invertase Pin-like site-specific DNA recombinase
MMATVIAGVAQFEREPIQERIRSGMAAAKERGRKLGRQPGQRPKSDRLAPRVIRMVEEEKLSTSSSPSASLPHSAARIKFPSAWESYLWL